MKDITCIKTIVYDPEYKSERITASFLSLPDKEHVEYKSEEELSAVLNDLAASGLGTKEVLVLSDFKGRIFQKCPGSNGMLCCNYSLLNTCFGCLYSCAYCFLNSYINFYGIRQFIHIDNMPDEIEAGIPAENGMIKRIGTGEFTDSLMFDEATGIAAMLMEKLSNRRDILIEFKTKSSCCGHLLELPRGGNVVLAWSLNTEYAIANWEAGTASLDERLSAARRAQEAGFLLAFHFDPIIQYPETETDYEALVHRLFSVIKPDGVVWISLGCFRYGKGFIKNGLTSAEMFPCSDGKLRYIKHFRRKMYVKLNELIKAYSSKPFVYLCMEDKDMWYDVFGIELKSPEELEATMSLHLKKTFPYETISEV